MALSINALKSDVSSNSPTPTRTWERVASSLPDCCVSEGSGDPRIHTRSNSVLPWRCILALADDVLPSFLDIVHCPAAAVAWVGDLAFAASAVVGPVIT